MMRESAVSELSTAVDIQPNFLSDTVLDAINTTIQSRSTPVAQLAPRNLLTRWDVSSIPANGIFLTKN